MPFNSFEFNSLLCFCLRNNRLLFFNSEREPYINSKFDVNRHWLQAGDESSWQPTEDDFQQIEDDEALDATYTS